MVYRNTKTGMVMETSCVISGEDWEAVRSPAPETEAPPESKKRKRKEKDE